LAYQARTIETRQKGDLKHPQAASDEPMLDPNSTPTPSISINGHDGHRVRIAILGLGEKREIEFQVLADGQLRTNTGNGDDSITTRGMVLKLPIEPGQAVRRPVTGTGRYTVRRPIAAQPGK
jgi:hypothetical protein